MSNEIIGTTTSSFQYRIESDIPEKLGTLQENILDFETKFKQGDFLKPELEKIARNLESTAVYFGEQQGLGGSKLLIIGEDNLKAKVNNNKIEFTNKTRDNYNRFYAGFVEYGHRSGKKNVPPRPFMRPALYAVAKASAGEIGDVLADLMMTAFLPGIGYQGVHKLNFGKTLGTNYFHSLPDYTVRNALSKQKIDSWDSLNRNKIVSKDKFGNNIYKKEKYYMYGEDLGLKPEYSSASKSWAVRRDRGSSSSFKAFKKLNPNVKSSTKSGKGKSDKGKSGKSKSSKGKSGKGKSGKGKSNKGKSGKGKSKKQKETKKPGRKPNPYNVKKNPKNLTAKERKELLKRRVMQMSRG